MNYILKRSKRKTIAIYIKGDCVEVRAPSGMSDCDINRFLLSKKDWIEKTLEKSIHHSLMRHEYSLNYGDKLTLRGKQYEIIPSGTDCQGFDGTAFCVARQLSPAQIKSSCIKIYRFIAKTYLSQRTAALAKEMGVMPSAVKINGAKTRWGSCSGQNNINFSWRLIMASDDVIDYVIVHELAHIMEHNHSKRFWDIVKEVFPDYKNRRVKLQELEQSLALEDWTENS